MTDVDYHPYRPAAEVYDEWQSIIRVVKQTGSRVEYQFGSNALVRGSGRMLVETLRSLADDIEGMLPKEDREDKE